MRQSPRNGTWDALHHFFPLALRANKLRRRPTHFERCTTANNEYLRHCTTRAGDELANRFKRFRLALALTQIAPTPVDHIRWHTQAVSADSRVTKFLESEDAIAKCTCVGRR